MIRQHIIYLLFFLVFNSFASEDPLCPNIRLDQKGGSMEKVPVQSQKMGTCYAYAAATVWDALRFSLPPNPVPKNFYNELTSPAYIAFVAGAQDVSNKQAKYHTDKNGKVTSVVLEGGLTDRALEHMMRNSTCVDTKGANSNLFDQLNYKTDEERRLFLKNLMDLYENYFQNYMKISLSNFLMNTESNTITNNVQKNVTQICRPEIYTFPTYYPKTLEAVKKDLDKLKVTCTNNVCKLGNEAGLSNKFVHNLILLLERNPSLKYLGSGKNVVKMIADAYHASCKKSPAITNAYANISRFPYKASRNTYQKLIAEALAYNNGIKTQPVSISICSKVLVDKNYISNNNPQAPNCGPHAVVLIGSRKTKDGKCEYLIRNSWGKCTNRNSIWPCDEKAESAWVSADAINANIYYGHFIKGGKLKRKKAK